MGFYKKFVLKTVTVASCLILGFSHVAFAMSYTDVPAGHWAYQAIDAVSNEGFLVGDLTGNFKPDDYIDKFETAKILAKMAGYKYADATAEEQAYYNKCYDARKAYISQFSAAFKEWNDTYDWEIAYLLEKGILTEADLNQFIILVDDVERLRALSREEACLFLTKVMGRTQEAAVVNPTTLFGDDSAITAAYRPAVYYFRQIGIVNGDSTNQFNPKGAITKAAMAIILQSVLKNMSGGAPGGQTVPAAPTAPGTAVETVQGTVAKLFPTARAIQVASDNEKYNNKIYIVSSTGTININQAVKTFADLAVGMTFTGAFSGNELISVTVSSTTTPPTSTPTTAAPTPTTPTPTTPAAVPAVQKTAEGTVTAVNAAASTIDFETRSISPRGEITAVTETYTVAANAAITRNGVAATLNTIVKGDIAEIAFGGGFVSRITLSGKDLAFTGTLTEKTFNETTGVPTLGVTDDSGTIYQFTITAETVIGRKGSTAATWSELRVGDAVDIQAEYEVLKSIYATGEKSSVDAWVKEIYISSTISKVTAADANNNVKVYPLITGAADPYAIRVGSKIRLRLDSDEVESFSILEDSQSTSFSGVITSVSRSSITMQGAYNAAKELVFDAKTMVVDSRTGRAISSAQLSQGMNVYVVFSETTSNYAKTIIILSY